MEKMNPEIVFEKVKEIRGWFVDGGSIKKTFKTKGFPATMGLVSTIGAICQQHDHHPDYMLVKYSEVEVSFSTHDANGITQKDLDIAKEINEFA